MGEYAGDQFDDRKTGIRKKTERSGSFSMKLCSFHGTWYGDTKKGEAAANMLSTMVSPFNACRPEATGFVLTTSRTSRRGGLLPTA